MDSLDFSKHFDAYSDELLRFCLSRVSDREVAKDLVQDTFIKLWEYAGKGNTIEEPRAFLYTTLKNKIIDHYRKHKSDSLDEKEEYGFDPADESIASPEMKASANYAIGIIRSLDEKYRDVLYLKLVEELTTREIAEALSITESNVSIRINRGMKKLRAILKE